MNSEIQNLINEKRVLNNRIAFRRERQTNEITRLRQEYFSYNSNDNAYRSRTNETLEKEIERENESFEKRLKEEFEQDLQDINSKLKAEKDKLVKALDAKKAEYQKAYNEMMRSFRTQYTQVPLEIPNLDDMKKEIEEMQNDINAIDASINLNGRKIIEGQKQGRSSAKATETKQPSQTKNPESKEPVFDIDPDINIIEKGSGEQTTIEPPIKTKLQFDVKPQPEKDTMPQHDETLQPKVKEAVEPDEKTNEPKKGTEQTDKKNLPIRSFWEIYDSTNTEHCGTIARLIHKMAKAPLFRLKGEDTVQKALSFIPNVLTFIPKLIAKPINYALRTDRKYEEMYENVNNLSQEEFAVLTESSENAMEVKNPRDKDYISSAAKQYKINDLYLDAVNAVYKKRQQEKIGEINERIAGYDARIRELRSKQEPLTIDEQVELANLGLDKDIDEQWGDKIALKVKTMEQMSKEKTSGYRNISGWFLGKFNPDNREFNHKMAELAKQRREAWERGEQDEATIITQKMDDLALAETDIRMVGTNSANTIDRGNTSIRKGTPCEILDRGQSTKTRLLIANLAVGAAALKTAQMIQNQKIIDAQQAEIVSSNAKNSANVALGNSNVKGIDQQLVEEAAAEYTHKNIASAHATGEYANLDARAMEHGGSWTRGLNSQEYRTNDDLLHAATTDVHNQVEGASMIDGVKASADYYSKVASEAIKAHQSYYPSHDFDYTGYMGSLEQAANSQAMVKLFETLQNTISANPAKFTATKDLLDGISNSADYALLALIGAGVLKDAMDRDYARPTSAPKPRDNKKDDRENDENAQDEQTNETNSRDGEDR